MSVECPDCEGQGGWPSAVDNTDMDLCDTCGGTGEVRRIE